MILSVEGEPKTGKSTIAYTSPGKVIGFGFDIGAARAIYGTKFNELFDGKEINILKYEQPKDKVNSKGFIDEIVTKYGDWDEFDIHIVEMPPPVQLDPVQFRGANEMWQTVMYLVVKAIEDEEVRSIVLDTGSMARRVAADAYLQTLQEGGSTRSRLQQVEWGQPNDNIRRIYGLLGGTGKNLIVVHHLKDDRAPQRDKRSGNMEMALTGTRSYAGMVDSDALWDVGLRTIRDPKSNDISFMYTICGWDLSLIGKQMVGSTWNNMISQIDAGSEGRLGKLGILERA